MSDFPLTSWQIWLEALQRGLVLHAWRDEDGTPAVHDAPASLGSLWAGLLNGPLAEPLHAAGLSPEVLAEVELQRIERVGAGPAAGLLAARDGAPSPARADLTRRMDDAGWAAARWATLRASQQAPRGLRRSLLEAPLRHGAPGAAEAARLAADSDEGVAWLAEVEAQGAPETRVRLRVTAGLAGGTIWEFELLGTASVEVVGWVEGGDDEWHLLLDPQRPLAHRYGAANAPDRPRLLAWLSRPPASG